MDYCLCVSLYRIFVGNGSIRLYGIMKDNLLIRYPEKGRVQMAEKQGVSDLYKKNAEKAGKDKRLRDAVSSSSSYSEVLS